MESNPTVSRKNIYQNIQEFIFTLKLKIINGKLKRNKNIYIRPKQKILAPKAVLVVVEGDEFCFHRNYPSCHQFSCNFVTSADNFYQHFLLFWNFYVLTSSVFSDQGSVCCIVHQILAANLFLSIYQ